MYNNPTCPVIFDEDMKGKKSLYVDIPGEPFAVAPIDLVR